MKNPTRLLITRESLQTTASCHARWCASVIAGTAMLGSSALAADWLGTTDNWNDAANWNPTGIPANPVDANINLSTPGHFPVLLVNATNDPRNVNVGIGASASGRIDVRTGRVIATNRVIIGDDGGSGILNIADTTTPVSDPAKFTPWGQSGEGPKLVVGERLYIGGQGAPAGVATGVANVNTLGSVQVAGHIVVGEGHTGGGTLNVDSGTITTTGGELWVGQAVGGVGRLNMSAGAINVNNNWVAIGRNGGNGTVLMTGGAITKGGGGDFLVGTDPGSTGLIEMRAGTINVNSGTTAIGDRNNTGPAPGAPATAFGTLKFPVGSTATFTVNANNLVIGRFRDSVGGSGVLEMSSATATLTCLGTRNIHVGNGNTARGTVTLSNGTINVNDWFVFGREAGQGTLNMTGGKIVKTGGGNLALGALGNNPKGTINLSGGLIDVQSGAVLIAEAGTNPEGTVNISGTGEMNVGTFGVGVTASGTGYANLDGGTLRTQVIDGGAGTAHVDFNGTQIIATANRADFINDLDSADVEPGGLKVNSNGFTLSTSQDLLNAGGGVVKSGAGVLNLNGTNAYAGASTVEGGTLNVQTTATGGGAYTVNGGATLGVTQATETGVLNVSNLTMNDGSTLNISLATAMANPAVAPVNVTGTLATTGTVTINLTDAEPATGTLPLVSYAGGSGANFVIGTIPEGVTATLVNTAGLVSLNVARVNSPHWIGDLSGVWDITTLNWRDAFTGNPTNFANGDPALFEDVTVSPSTFNVTLDTTVSPGSTGVTFDNITNFSLTSPSTLGKISGTKGLTKRGVADLTIGNLQNDFTGPARLEGGITSVGQLANAGSPSPLGAGNLVLAGGTLLYTGGTVAIDRGLQVSASANNITSQLSVGTAATNLTLGGAINATLGGFVKSGPGTLTLTNPGANMLGNGTAPAAGVSEGALILSGGGTQTNQVQGGEFWLGSSAAHAASLTMNGSSMTGSSWFVMSRANGTSNLVSSLTATNSSLTFANATFGYANGLPSYASTSNVLLTNSTLSTGTGTLYFGESGGATVNVTMAGNTTVTAGPFQLGRQAGSVGTLEQNGGTLTAGDNVDGVRIGGTGSGKWTLNAGTVNANGWNILGRFAGSTGELNVAGGTFNQSQADRAMIVAELGTGTVNISGSGVVNLTGNGGLFITNGTGSVGTVNLDGGTLTTKRIREGAGNVGAGTFNFNGGTLIAAAAADGPLFMEGLDFAYVKAGGANIDSAGQTITINQPLLAGTPSGGLAKSGTGTLRLNGVNTYTGTTTVTAGSLGGTGTIAGPIVVQAGAGLAPGAATGALTANGGVTFNSGAILAVTIDDSQAVDNGRLDATGTLNVTGVALQVNLVGTAGLPSYTIATAGTVTGTFASVPAGVVVTYNPTSITITPPSGTPFQSWIDNFDVGSLDQPGDDADGDGLTNREEFALDGDPSSGAPSGKVRSRIEMVGGEQALVVTLPVRVGATFDNNPGPGLDATIVADDLVYLIRGSNNLSAFDQGVTEVTPASTVGMPDLSDVTKWTYRTFRLNGVIPTRGARGFLDIEIQDAP